MKDLQNYEMERKTELLGKPTELFRIWATQNLGIGQLRTKLELQPQLLCGIRREKYVLSIVKGTKT